LTRVIFHVDLDAFYASVEIRSNPSYRGLPLIIGADPKDGRGRGVVVTCSYEARKFGVRSAQPISIAYKLCPNAVYVRPNFELYDEVSGDVMGLLKKFADKFEQASIDEAYLDVTQACKRYGGPVELAKQIKLELETTERLTCSIGIAPNKSIAKIASDMKKPNGLTYVDPASAKAFLVALSVSKISGIGKKTEQKLNELGVKTIGELAIYPTAKLYEEFGKNAVWLWAIANAEEQVEIQENYVIKSIGTERTFEEDTDDWIMIEKELRSLSESVHERLLSEKMFFKTVTLKIRFVGFETYTRSKTLRFSLSSKESIIDEILDLATEFKSHAKKVRLIGVRISSLEKRQAKTIDEFAS
jgi:DNA polymerase IV (DinB-like DNA polymerase)